MIYTITLNPSIDRTMHFPQLAIGELNRATRTRSDFSGKGVNVSVALARFGLDSVAMGFMAGAYGRVLVPGLEAMGLQCDFVEVPGETRSNVTVIDTATGVTTKLNEPGPTVTPEDLAAFEARLGERLAPGDVCVMSGALPAGAPPDTYGRLIATVQRRGATAVLDSSGAAMAAGCAAAPDLVKPNAVEAEDLVGVPVAGGPCLNGSVVACLEAIHRLGPRRVLLSLGALGGAYADGVAACLAEPPPITEVNAVGAGDTFLAVGLWAWIEGLPPEEITRWAVAGGTAAAMQDGTVIPSRAEIEEVYRHVHVRTLA
ncbi:MAG TPA: 1-phosphofructokinase family hexose kinase [Chloroflexi bacterium]|jgi:1-phosphofructokinase|nr:1-phosphofructokinase family hexose kinase [Chloroflexota bacterium]